MPNNLIPAYHVCGMENTYPDGENFINPDCSHEWSASTQLTEKEEKRVHKDTHGNILNDGDTVIFIKDLKVKGAPMVIRGGPKVKCKRLVDGVHNIDCKVDGRSMLLKPEHIKKA